MHWNARISNARDQLRRAICILPLTAMGFGSLAAQEMTPEAYHAEQIKLHQQVAAIQNDLNAGVVAPKRTALQEFTRQLRSGIRPTDPRFKNFQDVLRFYVFQLSDPKLTEDAGQVQQLKNNLERRISGVGSRRTLQAEQEAIRMAVMGEVLKLLNDLMENNFIARSVAIELMPTLIVFAPPNKPIAVRKMLPGVARSLVAILTDPKQPDTVKARAAMSIKQHLARVIAGGVDQARYVEAIHDELISHVKSPVYQYVLVDTLSMISIPRQVDGDREALAIETLVMVMQDNRRDLLTRCRAAAGLGQVGYDRPVNFDPIAWKIVQLAGETGDAYNAAGDRGDSWKYCGQYLYLAFHHPNAQLAVADIPHGILNRTPGSKLVNEAYRKTLPVAAHLYLERPSVPKDALKSASEWVSTSRPEDLSYEPQAEPIVP